jgi:hypothetical protein
VYVALKWCFGEKSVTRVWVTKKAFLKKDHHKNCCYHFFRNPHAFLMPEPLLE